MEIDWIAVRAFWDASGWEYSIVLVNAALAYYAYTNYRELAGMGNITARVAAVADEAARASAIGNLRRLKTIQRRLEQVNDAVNHMVRFVMKRVGRIVVFGLLIPVLIVAAVVSLSGGLGPQEALIFTLNNLSRGLFLDALEVFDINLLGETVEPHLSPRLLSVLVIVRFTAEATFWFSLASALGAMLGSLRLRIPGLRPQSIDQLNEKLGEAATRVQPA